MAIVYVYVSGFFSFSYVLIFFILCFQVGNKTKKFFLVFFSSLFDVPNIDEEFTDTPEKINDYIVKFCQKGCFIPSWLSAEELVEADFKNLDFLDD